MAYTDQEIADLTDKLVAAGAPTDKIKQFVSSAKEEQKLSAPPASLALRPDQVATQAAKSPEALAREQAQQEGLIPGANRTPDSRPDFMRPPPFPTGQVVDAGLEAGGATLGQAIGTPLAPATFGLSVPVLGALGGGAGNALAQIRRFMTGEQEKPDWGQLAGAGVSGSIPGASIGKGVIPLVKAGVRYGAGNVLAKTVETGIDHGQLPTGAQALTAFAGGLAGAGAQKILGRGIPGELTPAQKLTFERDQNFRDLRPDGVNVTPHEMGVGVDFTSSTGGKAATQQAVSNSNIPTWQRLAREDLGLSSEAVGFRKANPEKGVVSEFDEVRQKAYKPYEELAAISPKTAHDLDLLRQQNEAVRGAYDQYKNALISREEYKRVEATRDALENALQQKAASVGRPDLVPAMQEAKKRIAMSYAYQNATVEGSGFTHPLALADQLKNGVPLSDNARRMALYAQAFPKSSVVQGPVPGVNGLTAMAATNEAAQGTPSGVLAAGYQLTAPLAARKYQLSNFAQNRYASLPVNTVETVPSALIRFAAEQQARNTKR